MGLIFLFVFCKDFFLAFEVVIFLYKELVVIFVVVSY